MGDRAEENEGVYPEHAVGVLGEASEVGEVDLAEQGDYTENHDEIQ